MKIAKVSWEMRLGAVEFISFPMVIFAPMRSISRRWARIPRGVRMQVARAVATRSVGEKLAPWP